MGAPGTLVEKLVGAGLKGWYAALKHSGLDPGREFRVALVEAKAIDAKVVLGDRSSEETLRRLAAALSLTDVFRMITPGMAPPLPPEIATIFQLPMEEAIEKLKSRKMVPLETHPHPSVGGNHHLKCVLLSQVRLLVSQMREVAPGAIRALLDERDEILTQAALGCEGRTVAVVGLAHVDGVVRLWNEAQSRGGVLLPSFAQHLPRRSHK